MYLRSQRSRAVMMSLMVIFAIASGVMLILFAIEGHSKLALNLAMGVLFTLAVVGYIYLLLDPDTHTARQSDDLLQLASHMLDYAKGGLTPEAAQSICELLLPATSAISIAITDTQVVLGYAGYDAENHPAGRPIITSATKETLQDGVPRILHSVEDIGMPMSSARVNAAIVEPLYIGRTIQGTMKFYYRHGRQISQTQESIANGLAELLSTQMAASALEEQKKLTTSMELKALQAQINPHFLFNTINTISSLIRTDPDKARVLLREFAVFYRSVLEDSDDLIPLEREITQVERYFGFEVARFGEDRLMLRVDIDPEVKSMMVPSFMIQPLVENAVKHAMKAEGMLTVRITGGVEYGNIVIRVIDDGMGMSEETLDTMTEKQSDTGLGLAVKNVQSRIRSYFGPESHMEVKSELGKGTIVSFILSEEAEDVLQSAEQLQETAIPEIPDALVDEPPAQSLGGE